MESVKYQVVYLSTNSGAKNANFESFEAAKSYYDEKVQAYGQARVSLSIEVTTVTRSVLL